MGGIGVGLTAGFKSIFGTTNDELTALERFLAPYEVGDKKLISYEEKDGKKTYYYQNWSNNNAYDYLDYTFTEFVKNIQQGIETKNNYQKDW